MTSTGTESTLRDAPNPLGLLSTFAEAFVRQIPALQKRVRLGTPTGSAGRSKQSCVMPMNGLKKRKVPHMESQLARGFLTLLLSPKQRAELLRVEASLPPGRYLTGFEVCRMFRIQPERVSDFRMGAMSDCFSSFWKSKCIKEPDYVWGPNQKLMAEWMEWVAVHYCEPVEAVADSF